MRCSRIRGLLQAYLDHELDDARYWRVAAHLSGCEGCSRGLQTLRQLNELLGEAPSLGASPAFVIKVLERVHNESQLLTPTARVWGWSSFTRWLSSLTLTARAATVAIVLLALASGLQVGQMVTSLFAPGTASRQEADSELEITQYDRALLEVMRAIGNGSNNGGEANQTGGRQ